MISLQTAMGLGRAGLRWQPQIHDFFMIPDIGMDGHIFVISDMLVEMEVFKGHPAFTFVGAVEWALDYVLISEALWLPTDAQLRREIWQLVGEVAIESTSIADVAMVRVNAVTVSAATHIEALAQLLIHLLDQ